jgi:hypothetical protein
MIKLICLLLKLSDVVLQLTKTSLVDDKFG